MAGKLLPDDLWSEIEHLFPEYEPSPDGGRPPTDNRTALTVILFVLKMGICWADLPQELGRSGRTASPRLEDWNEQGVCHNIHAHLRAELHAADQIDWSRSLLDSGTVKPPLDAENQAARTWFSPLLPPAASPPSPWPPGMS